MRRPLNRALFSSVAFVAVMGCATPQPTRTDDFLFAQQVATKQSKSVKGSTYLRDVFVGYFERNAAPVLRRCLSELDKPDRSDFSVILAIRESGEVADVFLNNEHNTSLCFKAGLRSVRFPPPPVDMFYGEVQMRAT